jgi:hypothetical protein
VKANRKELIAALEPLRAALATTTKTAIPSLTHIWFDGKFAYAHDNSIGIRSKIETPFKLGVPGVLLLGLLNQAGVEELTLDAKENVLAFKAGKSNVKLATQPLSMQVWPYPPDKEAPKPLVSITTSQAFIAGLKRVFVVKPPEKDKKRMEHHSICIWPVEKEMDMYTTDSRILARAEVAEEVKGKIAKLALPRDFAEQVAARCRFDAVLYMYPDYFRVQATDTLSLYSNAMDTTGMLDLPKTAEHYTDEKKTPPFVIPKDLSAALDRALLMAGHDEPLITLATDGKKITLSGEFKSGEIEEIFDLTKAVPKSALTAVASALTAAKDVEKMMLSPEGLVLRGADGFMYIIAARGKKQSWEG